MSRILVVGAGISGLSCALLLKRRGYDVTIWAAEMHPHTTSNKAAAVWYPFIVNPPELATRWARETLAFIRREFIDKPESGVTPIVVTELFEQPKDDPWWRDAVPEVRRLKNGLLPNDYRDGYEIDAAVMVTNTYVAYLTKMVQEMGVPIILRRISALEEALPAADVVINCTGLGARTLCNDMDLKPTRGQIIRIRDNGFKYSVFEEEGRHSLAYIIPRGGQDIILGGTAQVNDWDTRPRPEETRDIIARCAALYPCFERPEILGITVGLRPSRSSIRLESDVLDGKPVVHNYGHGGSGLTLSFGCANEVVQLVEAL